MRQNTAATSIQCSWRRKQACEAAEKKRYKFNILSLSVEVATTGIDSGMQLIVNRRFEVQLKSRAVKIAEIAAMVIGRIMSQSAENLASRSPEGTVHEVGNSAPGIIRHMSSGGQAIPKPQRPFDGLKLTPRGVVLFGDRRDSDDKYDPLELDESKDSRTSVLLDEVSVIVTAAVDAALQNIKNERAVKRIASAQTFCKFRDKRLPRRSFCIYGAW